MVTCLYYINSDFRQDIKTWALLIDPDKATPKSVVERVKTAEKYGVSRFLVGGSFISKYRTRKVIRKIREHSDKKILLFPGSVLQIEPEADAILFLSLISGRNPEYLIGQHVTAAPILNRLEMQVIPTSYLLIDGGKPSSASYISGTFPIPHDKPDLAAATALAGEYLGHLVCYLDTGSGAERTVHPETVKRVRETVHVPIIVGGGIRTAEQVSQLSNAGADILVIGSALENETSNNEELLLQLKNLNFGKDKKWQS